VQTQSRSSGQLKCKHVEKERKTPPINLAQLNCQRQASVIADKVKARQRGKATSQKGQRGILHQPAFFVKTGKKKQPIRGTIKFQSGPTILLRITLLRDENHQESVQSPPNILLPIRVRDDSLRKIKSVVHT
jgi:hypothetical protein